ncbi:MAG: helix-turn-helix domain-containing protein [Bryobacteraceae bacterium]
MPSGDIKTLAELAAESGVPARTIRYYIARGLLEGPAQLGRAAAYTARHLAQIKSIRKLQERGLMLGDIARELSAPAARQEVPEPASWWHYPVAGDVVVMVRAGAAPWRLKQVREALATMAARLKEQE